MIAIRRLDIRLKADTTKVILKFLDFNNINRIYPVYDFIKDMADEDAEKQLQQVMAEFEDRHFNLKSKFEENFEKLGEPFVTSELTEEKKLLLGAYFTHEYSVEASVFFNPSIVPFSFGGEVNPDLQGFVLSLRATGEGHVSSLAFLAGNVDKEGKISLHQRPRRIATPKIIYDNSIQGNENYTAVFDDDIPITSRILFPVSRGECNGIEDARFVLFEEEGKKRYLATYTAYNGVKIHPKLIETDDFQTFHIMAFTGTAASDKGFALFPEKIDGKYAMIGRQGGRNMNIMYSHDLYHWDEYQALQVPQRSWEMLQMGNCGSPIKTKDGWLLLTHAVGPMRKYVLSISLLDLNDPSIVIASLDEPLLSPTEEEREGYVPNVLYTCGMMLHKDDLIIPYAMSDSAIGFATVAVKDVLDEMLSTKKG